MKELRCPHCGNVFKVDREMFESIAAQVRNEAFNEELETRIRELRRSVEAEYNVKRLSDGRRYDTALADKDREIAALKASLSQSADRQRVAVLEEERKNADALRNKDIEINELRNRIETQKKEAQANIATLKEQHALVVSEKDREIQFHKDFKARLSTKMIGESLEIHCHTLFSQAQSMGMFQNAFFEKDNDARGGSKGDFIFRDYIDGVEYISIMFEMKNESDSTSTKHRNDDFLEKLDHDRREKKCEYAVLVSMLERDNELYNDGIVNKSHRYPKMYVIRPQMFMPLISILSQAARKNMAEISALRTELEIARSQSIDVTNFEKRRDRFVADFGKLVEAHVRKHTEAIGGIDKVIEALEKQVESLKKVKALFETSEQKLVKANESAENDFTIKKLTYGNPTMKAKFEQARENALEEQDEGL